MESVRKLILCGLLFSADATCAAEQGFYFGAMGGQSDYAFESARLSLAPGISSITWPEDAENDASAWGLSAGYRIFRYAAVELNYVDLGKLERTETHSAGRPPLVSIFTLKHELETSGLAISGLGVLPVSDAFELYLRGGAFFADMEATTSVVSSFNAIGIGGGSIDFSSQSLLWGGGVQFNWSDHWSARLDYQRLESVGEDSGAGVADIDLLSLGVLYRL